MFVFILIVVAGLTIIFTSRMYDLEQRYTKLANDYKVIVADYKQLSHHVLITNRDGLRPQKDSNWVREDVSDNPDRVEGPWTSCSTKETYSEN